MRRGMVFDRRTISRVLDKRGNPGRSKQNPNVRQRVNPIYKAEGQEPDNKATRKD